MIVKGVIKRIGAGTWYSAGSRTRFSLIEIGEHTIRNLYVSEYLGNFLEVGADVEVLIHRQLFGRTLYAIKRDGKVYKEGIWVYGIFFLILAILLGTFLLAGLIAKNPVVVIIALGLLVLGARPLVTVLKFK